MAAFGGRGCRRLAAETKGGKGTIWFPCPLLTPPNPPLRRDSLWSRGETGETGLSSVRRFAFGTLLCPEFSLRKLPRITVRGHPVQGGSVLLRKALLQSIGVPWSTRRPCGPLAFRRATEGSRVRGKMWGCQEGDKKPGGCLGPPLAPAAGQRQRYTPSEGVKSPPPAAPLYRRYRLPSAEGKERKLLLPQKSKNLPVSREVLNIYVSNRISVFGAALSVQYGCRAAAS